MVKNNIEWRISQLEKRVDEIDRKIEIILTNHLPHINEAIIGMQTRINVLTAVNIGAIILALMIQRLF